MGWFICGFGATLPFVQDEQHLSATKLALHGLALGIGATVSGLIGGKLVARFGRGVYLRASSVVMALGIAGYISFHLLPLTLFSAFLAMLGGGSIAQATATYLQSHHGHGGTSAITEMHGIIAGIGVFSPVLIGVAVAQHMSWRVPMAVAIVAVLIVEVVRGSDVSRYGVAHSAPDAGAHRDAPGALPVLFRWTLVTMACTASIEFCVSLWASRLLRDQGNLGNAAAAASLGCIFGGMFIARLVVARWATRIDSQPIYTGSLALTLVAFVVFWTAHSGVVMTIALLLCGIGIAPHFPLGMARAMVASRSRQDRAAAATLAMSGFASGVSPFALGALADQVGVHSAYAIVLVAVVVALTVAVRRPIHAVVSDVAE